ncbi:cyclic pyranopterin monophosphate synthase MoaC [Acetonema longum]|uniref:Cyclic pyranopterin monophosphate synthase n=1 Tax=Acetonema longum DSM 6540 TaxID=1009370 RepID=F7NQ38_9FIRM|nr:cyclic pyranopterin monophosphate synthase MoaC [Acetonema longum]EGO61797.1 molybdenum cofactor biosynthesis protein C [Acetonema longum DSM 6540]
MELTHFDQSGKARMVDVTEKNETKRVAVATGRIVMQPETLALIRRGEMGKGDVLGVAQVAGVMGAKKTWELIPMCHPLLLTGVKLDYTLNDTENSITVQATVSTTGKTGVEMEALTAVSVAALTVYDMCKAVDKSMTIESIQLLHKSGGKSGIYSRGDK